MGALGLEGRGRRPHGKGCLLLAVAGATSLVTLLLAVPITVLAVLALVPQEQGGPVTGTADPGAQAQAQQRSGAPSLGPGPLSSSQGNHAWMAALAPNRGLFAPSRVTEAARGGGRNRFQLQAPSCPPHRAHLLLLRHSPLASLLEQAKPGLDLPTTVLPTPHSGAWTKGQGLGWEAKKEEAFLRSGTQFSGAEGLALPQDGLYYLYCHVGYRGRAPPAGGGLLDHSVTLHSRLYRTGGAYGPGTPELLLEGAETVTPVLDPARTHEYGPLWYTSVGFGGLVQLRRGERVYVNISHPDLVDYRRGKTFFGAVMVG